jgi:hypothetical protein
MTQLEMLTYAVLRAHRPLMDEEMVPNGWRTLCACHAIVADHDEHLASEVAKVLLRPEAAPAGLIDGIYWEQLTLQV